MGNKDKDRMGIAKLIIALVVVLIGGVVFVGAVGGWFDDAKVAISGEYLGDFEEFQNITASDYEKLIENKKSFVLLVDQAGCTTADRLREFVEKWARDAKIKVPKIMFSELKKTSLHENVKYYPSVVVVSQGKVKVFLRADSDEDAEEYNKYETFKEWIGKYV